MTLDDVHLADGSSWEALNYLSRNLADFRLLVLLAARPEELAEHPVAGEVVWALEQEGLLTRLHVTPLARRDVRELAEELVGAPVTDGLVDWLVARAQGSPLFVTGLVRALLEEGGDLAQPSLRALPEDLADRVQARLRTLGAGDRATLELLTVIGYRAELRDLLRLSGHSLDDLAAILDRLAQVRLVAELEEGGELLYEISHPLIQEAIYSQISGARRRSLHRHAARVLVEAGRYGAAASHVVQAADPGDDEAIETLCEALRRAEAGEHHREALALLEALLTMVPAGDKRWRNVAAVMPVTPEWVVDHRADVDAGVGVQAMRRADQVLERSGDAGQRAAVKFSLGSFLIWGMAELEAGRELIAAARDLFFEAGDQRAGLLAANEMGYHLGIADDLAGHATHARNMLEQAQSVGDEFLRLQALCSLAWALAPSGHIEESLPVVDQAIEIAADTDRAYRRSYLIAMRGWLRGLLGDPRARRRPRPGQRGQSGLPRHAPARFHRSSGVADRRPGAKCHGRDGPARLGRRGRPAAGARSGDSGDGDGRDGSGERGGRAAGDHRPRLSWPPLVDVQRDPGLVAGHACLPFRRPAGRRRAAQRVDGGSGRERLLALGAVHAGRSGRVRRVQPERQRWPAGQRTARRRSSAAARKAKRRTPGPGSRHRRLRIGRGRGGGSCLRAVGG